MKLLDFIALSIFVLQYAGYHLVFLKISKQKRWETRDRLIGFSRKQWLEVIIKQNNPLLGVQTIRNLTMTNTFLISIALIVAGGLFSIFSNNINWLETLEKGSYNEFLALHPVAIKLLVALTMLIISATNFLFSLRILYNMNFTISSSVIAENVSLHLEQLERHNKYFIVGIRALYFFIGPMFWIIDPVAMIVFTTIATFLYFHFDFIKISRDV